MWDCLGEFAIFGIIIAGIIFLLFAGLGGIFYLQDAHVNAIFHADDF